MIDIMDGHDMYFGGERRVCAYINVALYTTAPFEAKKGVCRRRLRNACTRSRYPGGRCLSDVFRVCQLVPGRDIAIKVCRRKGFHG